MIRDDLDALARRNREVSSLTELLRDLEEAVAASWADRPERLTREQWLVRSPTEVASETNRGPQYVAYYRLKLRALLDDLGEIATRVAGFDDDSDERSAIRCFIQAWFDLTVTEPRDQNQFLLDFDLGYRMRRLKFVTRRIDDLLRLDARARRVLLYGAEDEATEFAAMEEEEEDFLAALTDLKAALNRIFLRLRKTGRHLRTRGPENPIAGQLSGLPLDRSRLLSILAEARDTQESVANAAEELRRTPELGAALDELASALRRVLKPTFLDPDLDGRAVLDGASDPTGLAVAALLRFYDDYEDYDAIALQVARSPVGETARVGVIRVSPEDATNIVDEVDTKRRKLGGIELAHFGGFFRREWRENDFLWGRLDAAERLIAALVPDRVISDGLRRELLEEAQDAILIEEFGLDGPDARDQAREIVARLGAKDVERDVPVSVMADVVGRSMAVTNRLLGGTLAGYGFGSIDWFIAVAGRLVAGVVEGAVGRTRKAWIIRSVLLALLAASAGLVVWGAVTGRGWLWGLAAPVLALALLGLALLALARWRVMKLRRSKHV
jgi:hypothetical protein